MQGHPTAGRSANFTTSASVEPSRGLRIAVLVAMTMLMALMTFVSQAGANPYPRPLTGVPTFTISTDEGPPIPDDQPGQKDINLQGVASPAPGQLWTMWQWDDTSLSGKNTFDACSLFDTNGDLRVNAAVCVTVENTATKPATLVQQIGSPRLYTCVDTRVDRCQGAAPITLDTTHDNTNCGDQHDRADPFTRARCTEGHPGDLPHRACGLRRDRPEQGGSREHLLLPVEYPRLRPVGLRVHPA